MNLAFLQSPVQGDTGTKCDDVTISPLDGDIPVLVDMSTTQTSGHIFYVVGNSTATPQHNGDNAISPTVRVGSNHGTVYISTGITKYVAAVCVQAGFLDSNVTRGGPYAYDPSGDL